MNDLKPCPFCGDKPTLGYDEFDNFYMVKCDSSECGINPSTGHCDTEECAIECWNDRTDSSSDTDAQLQPCPLCGNIPMTSIDLSRYGRMGDCIAIKIICSECHLAKSAYIREGTDFVTVKEAMNKLSVEWNTRIQNA